MWTVLISTVMKNAQIAYWTIKQALSLAMSNPPPASINHIVPFLPGNSTFQISHGSLNGFVSTRWLQNIQIRSLISCLDARCVHWTLQTNIYSRNKRWQKGAQEIEGILRRKRNRLWCCLYSTSSGNVYICVSVTCRGSTGFHPEIIHDLMTDWNKEGEERWMRWQCCERKGTNWDNRYRWAECKCYCQ